MKGRKATVFIVQTIIFTGLFLFLIFYAPELIKEIGNTLLTYILINGFLFVGGTLTKDFIKSKFFREELFNEEKNLHTSIVRSQQKDSGDNKTIS